VIDVCGVVSCGFYVVARTLVAQNHGRDRPTFVARQSAEVRPAADQATFQLGPFMLWGLSCFKYVLPLDSFSRSKPMYPFSKPTKSCNLRV
jgi:hypothetical protein